MPGIVVSSRMLRQFLETIHWTEPLFADLPYSSLRLDIENPRQLQSIAQRLRQSIETSPLPAEWMTELNDAMRQLDAPTLVLRPSLLVKPFAKAYTPNAGAIADGKSSALFDIQICHAVETEVADGLKRLWAQLFRAKSLFYWQRRGIPLPQVQLAVLIQPLQAAIASGTVNILDQTFEVQATPGLGMATAWGEASPDIYQIQADSGVVQTQQMGNRAIVYQVTDDPASIPSTAAAILPNDPASLAIVPPNAVTHMPTLPSPSPGLPLPLLYGYLPDKAQLTDYALDDAQLAALVQLGHRLVGSVSAFEWVMRTETGDRLQFYLTQVTPLLPPTQAPVLPQPPREQRALTETDASRPDFDHLEQTSHRNTVTDNGRSSLLVTGLAASPGRAIARASVILNPNEPVTAIPPGTILVAEMLPPQWLPLIKQAAAIVIAQGSMTSHTAIIARAVGVPAVVAAAQATQRIQPGEMVMVDGDRGRVYRISETHHATEGVAAAPIADLTVPLSTHRPRLGVRLMASLSQPEVIPSLAALPIDGIGLLRSEMLTIPLLDYEHPAHWLQQGRAVELVERLAAGIRQFAAAITPRPVFYRSIDLRSHEARGMTGGEATPPEINPALGLHGTFSYCLDPTLFDLELAALAQVQTHHPNVHLILPFVRTVEEFQFCRQRVEVAGLSHQPQFQLWIMAEVPSVLFLLPDYVNAGVQGIAIGTNDLTQFMLAADRDHGQLATAFAARHPAVKAAIAQLIRQAHELGIPCSICGQAVGHDADLVESLVRWGATTIVVDPDALEATYWAIARAERRHLLERDRPPLA